MQPITTKGDHGTKEPKKKLNIKRKVDQKPLTAQQRKKIRKIRLKTLKKFVKKNGLFCPACGHSMRLAWFSPQSPATKVVKCGKCLRENELADWVKVTAQTAGI